VLPAWLMRREQRQQRHEREHPVGHRPGEVEHGFDHRRHGPERLGPDVVGEPTQGQRQQEGHHPGDRHPEADLRTGEADDLGEVDRGAGEERAGGERRQHTLQGQVAFELGRREDTAEQGDHRVITRPSSRD